MLRRLARWTALLVLGVMTTIAVAAGGVYFASWRGVEHRFTADRRATRHWNAVWRGTYLFRHPPESEDRTVFNADVRWREIQRMPFRREYVEPIDLPKPGWQIWWFWESGWPLYALRGWEVTQPGVDGTVSTHRQSLIQIPPHMKPSWARLGSGIPTEPSWVGIVINSIFYTACWYTVFTAGPFTRAILRRRRGRCPKCGYDLRGDYKSGCPECGWKRSVEQAVDAR